MKMKARYDSVAHSYLYNASRSWSGLLSVEGGVKSKVSERSDLKRKYFSARTHIELPEIDVEITRVTN